MQRPGRVDSERTTTTEGQAVSSRTSAPPVTRAPRADPGHRITRQVGLVCVAALVLSALEASFGILQTQAGLPRISWWFALRGSLPGWIIAGATVPLIFALSRRFPFRRGNWTFALIVHFVGAMVFSFVHVAMTVYSWRLWVQHPRPLEVAVFDMLRQYFSSEFLIYASIVGVWHGLHYQRESLARERDAAELRAHLTRAQLEALRLQLNPHFLFNTLNAIAVLARGGHNEAVVRMVNHLADLLRSVLAEDQRHDVPLASEVDLLRSYIDIMSVRFEDRLTVRWAMADECLSAHVPALILQPIVENAIVHGIGERPGPGSILLSARREDADLILEILDSGDGAAIETRSDHSRGLGLANVRARLAHRYGQDASLERYSPSGGGTGFRLRLPFEGANGGDRALREDGE
jgi:hypothetical protein